MADLPLDELGALAAVRIGAPIQPGSDYGRALEKLIHGFRLEWALLTGLFAAAVGLAVDGHILYVWLRSHGGLLDETVTHLAIFAGTLLAIGVEIIFSAFFLSILKASRVRRWN